MKAVLNVKGTKLSVLAVHYRTTGEPSTVYAMDENGTVNHFLSRRFRVNMITSSCRC
ncbi:hypothetical protein AABM34_17045 [Lysinibacillus fusiformis]